MKRRRWFRMLAAGSVVLGLSFSTTFVGPVQAREAPDRYAIGDSVMLGARTALREAGFGVDASQSRQATAGRAILRDRGPRLPENVVVHLGTNGTFPLASCRAMVRQAGVDRRLFFVTIQAPRRWKKSNNAVIHRCDAGFADDRVHVVDWARRAAQHPNWLYSDGIHLRPAGSVAFTRMIDEAVDAAIAAGSNAPHGAA